MPEITPSRYVVNAGWDDVPHLDEKTKRELTNATPPYLRKARTQGTPSLGAGAIYPIDPEEIMCEPFIIPRYWKRVYALDVGWKRTAALWGAVDPDSGQQYITAEYYRGQALPIVHAEAIKARGDWVPGVIDPAARGRNQKDGSRLIEEYQDHGLILERADNSVSAGLFLVWEALSLGRTKVFRTLPNFFAEFRLYRRNEKGEIVKEFDHLMDCGRYLHTSGFSAAITQPTKMLDGTGRGHSPADKRGGY